MDRVERTHLQRHDVYRLIEELCCQENELE
jgi:hypothetical protein